MPVEFEFKLIVEFVKRLTGDEAVCKLETIVAAAAAAAADTAEALLLVDGGRLKPRRMKIKTSKKKEENVDSR